jgi:formamidopyrimidine-DNA glycosylase
LRSGGEDPYVRAWWALDDGAVLELRDVRRFGRIGVVAAGEYASLPTLAAQGPEPWDPVLDDGGLWQRLRRSNVRVKTQLLSQRPLAGVGNIYADEALWRAGVHPSRRSVTRAEAARLLRALREVLEQGIANGGTTLRDYRTVDGGSGRNQLELGCYGRAGEPCLRCGDLLRRSVVDARGTTHCPRCQPRR